MAAYTDYMTPTGRIVVRGEAPIKVNKKVITASHVIPGRMVMRDTSDGGIKVADGTKPVLGWVGYEDSDEMARPATMATAYTVNYQAPILSGGGFAIQGWILAGAYAEQGDLMASFIDGTMIPCEYIGGKLYIKYPYAAAQTALDTYMVLPAGMTITDVAIRVTTAASGHVDVGFNNAVEGGDIDGLLDGEDTTTTTGIRLHNMADASAANITMGLLLQEVQLKDANAVYVQVPLKPGYVTGGTYKTIEYTSSATTVGYILIQVSAPGIRVVGKAVATVDNSAGTVPAVCIVESEL